MTDQFDLEQGIMTCWNVTSDLDVLFEELCENSYYTMDNASNFVLGLNTIYEAKFSKLFRTFEEFLKTHYALIKEVEELRLEVYDLKNEQEKIEEANALAAQESLVRAHAALEKEFNPESKSLSELFAEEEESQIHAWDEDDRIDFVEDEFGFN